MATTDYEPHEIYLITNLTNGKKYVGFTKTTAQERWTNHIKQAHYEFRRNEVMHKNGNRPILAAIRKYGSDSFKIECIDHADCRKDAGELEKFWIAHHKSLGKGGYNITSGGDGVSGYVMTESHKKQMSDRSIGDKNYWYGRSGDKHFGYGKNLTIEHIEKLRENNAGSKPITINGETYRSKAEAMRVFGVPKSSVDRLVSWESEISKIQHYRVEIGGIKYFGIKEAARDLNTTKYKLDREITLHGRGRYITEPYTFYEFVAYLVHIGKSPRPLIYNGVRYDSIRKLSEKLGYNRDVILRKIRDGEILESDEKTSNATHNSIPVEFCGEVFRSKTQLMEEFNISGKEFNRMLASGDIKEA